MLILLIAFQLAARPASEFEQRMLAHHLAWERLYRKYRGCPSPKQSAAIDDTEAQRITCRPALGELDRKAFAQACESARNIFQLTGPCK